MLRALAWSSPSFRPDPQPLPAALTGDEIVLTLR